MVELSNGSVFVHRFVVEKRIQAGGMGLVYRARDRQSNRPVALKLLQREATSGEVDRFMREARTLSELHHPGIVSYVAHGISSEGQPYLAMEWLEGEDLSARLRRLRMTVPEVLILLRTVGTALQMAHQAGVLHRDIKPSNLFLRDGQIERATLIDFGLARRVLGGGRTTQTGVVVGTPEYMSPEQARGDRQIGQSTDIFSLGCVAFECLTGQPPFVSEHIASVLAKILFEEAPPLNLACPEAPEPLVKLIAKMLAKNPLARLSDGTELLAAMDALGDMPNTAMPRTSSTTGSLRFEMAGTEQALVSVVIAQGRDVQRDARLTLDPASMQDLQSQGASMRNALAQFGVNVECMVDGSLIATISRQGAPSDQAIHAARCALVIRERWPDSVVALATGRAVVDAGTMFGEVLGRVGLMIETAREDIRVEPGTVVIDRITSRLVENHFSIARKAELRLLSGVGQPADESRPLLGVPTQCVGRERELSLLDATFASCRDNSTASVVLVSSPAGVGKSRLRHEFMRHVKAQEPDTLVLMGRGDPMSAGASYGLLAQALRKLFGVVEGQEPEVQQNQIRAGVSAAIAGDEVARVAEFLGEMCGVPFPSNVRLNSARLEPRVMADQVSQAFIEFLGSECTKRPVLLLLEDLHWGDALTVKLVDSALRDLPDQSLMVLALARPEVEDLFPKLWAGRARQDIRLGGLGKRPCERLIQQVLGNKITPAIQNRIIEQAAGNALFLEELIRAVAEGKGDELPETVLAILHARLMRMAPDARRVLRTASVFGTTFWEGGVRKLLGRECTQEKLTGWLQILVDAEIIERLKESRLPKENEYRFRHGLVREAAYGMLPDEERRLGHYLVGCYLEEVGEHDPLVLAEHFQRSGDLARAIVLYARATEQAYDNNDLEQTLSRAEKGLACGAEGEVRGGFLTFQAGSWFLRNELAAAFEAGTQALELLTVSGTIDWCRALIFTMGSAAALGRSADVADLALRFGSTTPAPEILGMYITATALFATTLGFVGDREMANLFMGQLKELAGPIADKDPYARAWMYYALGRWANGMEPTPYSAVKYLDIARSAYQLIGDRRMAAGAMGDLGLALARLGASAEAERVLREALPSAVRLHEEITLVWVQMYLALVLAERTDSAARAEAKQLARDVLKTIGEGSYYSGIAYCALAAAHRADGDLQAAEDAANKAVAILRGIPSNAPLAYAALGRTLLQAGRIEEAAKVAAEGMKPVEALGGAGGSEVPLRLLRVEIMNAQGAKEAAEKEQRDLQQQLELCIANIPDPAARDSFLARIKLRNGMPVQF